MTDTLSTDALAARVTAVFERIHREQMAGLPLLNEALAVAAVGFRMHQGRPLGMVVTPWMMSLLLLPAADDRWEAMALGDKATHIFPGGSLRFLVNVIDGLGACQMHSVHSPMRTFTSQMAAVVEAEAWIERLLTVKQVEAPTEEDLVDEQLLGRILRGERVPEVEAALAQMPTG